MKKNKIINIFFVITIVVVLLQGFTFASNNTSSNSSNSAQMQAVFLHVNLCNIQAESCCNFHVRSVL